MNKVLRSLSEYRKQLTLFINDPKGNIEKIRADYNPKQYNLISAHVTLCREDEIIELDTVIERIKTISLKKPVLIKFKQVERFAEKRGVLIPASDKNIEFSRLRKSVLGQTRLTKKQLPHITLMHPRNSICSDEIFAHIKKQELPTEFVFGTISLIEQRNKGKWNVLQEFNILNKKGSQQCI